MPVVGRIFGDRRLATDQAQARLEDLIRASGYRVASPDLSHYVSPFEHLVAEPVIADLAPSEALKIFEQFMSIPVNCSHDGMLVEVGTYHFRTRGGEQFEVSLVRQFMIEVDGEYDHMEHLHCLFLLPPREDLRNQTLTAWLEEHPSLEAYLAYVKASPAWQAAVSESGFDCTIWHEEV